MGALKRLRAIIVVVAKRVVSQPWLILATILGLVISIALMMSIPLYSDAVYHRIFLQNIADDDTPEGIIPPFTFTFRYDGSIYGSVEWDDVVPVDAYLTEQAGKSLGLPQQFVVRYFTTDPFGIFADEASAFNKTTAPLLWSSFAFLSDLENHITITEGAFPQLVEPGSGDAIEVVIHEDQAIQYGFQVGEIYIAFLKVRTETGFIKDIQYPIRISGLWRPTDARESYWFFNANKSFAERMLIPEETFANTIATQMEDEIYTAIWYLVLDGAEIHHSDADSLISRTLGVQQQTKNLLTNTNLSKSPLDALVDYKRSSNLLTILLYAFSIPIFGLLLAFVLLTSSLVVERRRNEIAVLRSRGARSQQMLGIAAMESTLLGGIALALSSPTAIVIAGLIGQARSFLDFSANNSSLRLILTANTLRFGIGAVVIVVLAQVMPTFGASSHTIVSYKREQARMLRKPWWQRAWLDILLLIAAGYGAYQLQQQGSLVRALDSFGNSPYQNPLLFLVPALGIFALTLFFLRLMPLVMSGIAWFVSHTKAVGLLMAVRHLARTPNFYNTPLILLVLTLSLSAFTASLASTLDEHLVDNQFYQSGADIKFKEMGEGNQQGDFASLMGGAAGDSEEEEDIGPRWYFQPVSEYENANGVEVATRVARYEAVANVGSGRQTGVYLGVERATFPQVSFWREDFAADSLGALMNSLAAERRGVLVPKDFLRDNVLLLGDDINLQVTMYGQRTLLKLKVIGSFEYFPTWYPSEGPLFIGDLDYLFETAGGQFPYDVWIATSQDVDLKQLVENDLNSRSLEWEIPAEDIAAEQALPERQGLFGLLSVGFASAAVLTVLGFLLYALFSFRRRFIEFGVLRAVGLSSAQMTAFLGWELAFLILMGGGLGTILGGWVSAFFIPFLQIGVDEVSRIPPYSVAIAWSAIFRIYLLFGALFIVALIALVVMLRRMRIFEAVKLGETA